MTSFQANGTVKPNQISSQVKCLMTVQDIIFSQVKCLMIVQDVITIQVKCLMTVQDVIYSQVKCLMTVQDVISSQVKCLMTVQDVISSQVGMIRTIFIWILMTQWLARNSRTFLVFFQVMDVYIPLSNLFKYGWQWLFIDSPLRVSLCHFKLGYGQILGEVLVSG